VAGGNELTDTNIDKVDKNRWALAQQWEREYWKSIEQKRSRFGKPFLRKLLSWVGLKPRYSGDDWNRWWRVQFKNYDFLPPRLENAVELGCGPYTNARLIAETCEVNHLFLSDPLIRDYVKFKSTFVNEMYRAGQCFVDDHPIEETPFAKNYFDLVVMINVLDHVHDAKLCMSNAVDLLKSKGILIIGQDLTDETDMHQSDVRDDIGHPIKIDHRWIDSYLTGHFENIIYHILPREAGRNPEAHYGTYIFAGRKLI
jgi:SAM-dependent methyltransferase